MPFERASPRSGSERTQTSKAVLALRGAVPLKGRSVKLVGRADPRGTQEYNMALGERRSNAVLKYLAALGVGAGQMTETSRGAAQ